MSITELSSGAIVQSFAEPSIAKMSITEPSIAVAVALPLTSRYHHDIHY
jgi:hypothetical protein